MSLQTRLASLISAVGADIKAQQAQIDKRVVILGQSAVGWTAPADTVENALATIAVPANAMGPNGRLRITAMWSYTNSANNKTLRIRFGSMGNTAALIFTTTTSLVTKGQIEIANRNSVSAQLQGPTGNHSQGGWATSTAAPSTLAVDTTVAQNIYITGVKALGSETIKLESYLVELMYGA